MNPYVPGRIPSRTPVMGRLFSLSHYTNAVADFLAGGDPKENQVVINFPSMPDSIDLARSANYKVYPTLAHPDGAHHQYQGTDPAEIPFSFRVHAFDEYCNQGSLTLLQIAGALHALTLPIGDSSKAIGGSFTGTASEVPNSEQESRKEARSQNPGGLALENGGFVSGVAFPVAAKLELIYIDGNAPGISCVGYVKSVRTRLIGPFLAAPDASAPTARNLPSALEAEFTFVHRPSHTNSFAGDSSQRGTADLKPQVQAYADDVKNRLYNTSGLISGRTIAYKGFNK